ncbi:LacI family DNA-binding transcriptional regulator [Gryllotalpicola kribbensis]|uniref:LacI family DNA-binding transcriptional regulator n=1 Tax=Gryllotalpicola kribbensis TaxID=993084 RepID=A0ABP8APE7_9MICO
MAKPTVYDVAAHARVSIATVSRVLRRPDLVKDSTKEQVLAAVRALGYVPSASARGLAGRTTGVIGLYLPAIDGVDEAALDAAGEDGASATVRVVRDIPDSGSSRVRDLYYDEVLRGAQLEAWRQGFVLTIGVGHGGDPERMVRDMAGRVDGLLIVARSVPEEMLGQLSGSIPIVLIAGPRRGDSFDHVGVANREGMRALTAHIVSELGVRDPVYVFGPEGSPDDAERYAGFVAALASVGVDASALRTLRGDFRREGGRAVAAALVAEGRDALPRAVICGNDQMALGMLDEFGRAGVRVPTDVLVSGFDGIEETRLSSPRLTTVRQPMEELGRAAVRAMVDRLEAPDTAPITRRLPVEVLLRESTETVSD